MASFNNFYVAVTFFISFTLLLKTSIGSEALQPPSQGPSSDTNYAPRPSSSYEKYLSKCASKLTPNCGQQVFFGVFVGDKTVSNKCCQGLVNDVGRSCHMDITNNAIKLPQFEKKKTEILNRALKVWNDCSLVHSA